VRGVNVFPSMVEEILLAVTGLTGNYQIVVDRTQKRHDAMQVLVEAEPGTNKEHLSHAAQERIKELIGLTVEVTVLAGGVLPRSEGKAKRVVDRRELNG
jgi:phenylacetate-CoA ligase